MADEDIMNFCNQYLISKVILSDPTELISPLQKPKTKKPEKTTKRHKFEKPKNRKV